MIRNLVLSGGSVRSVSAVGCLKYLYENGLLDHVTNIIGTSAGAILGFLLAMGHNPTKIATLLQDVLVGKGYHQIRFDDLLEFNVLQTFGLDSGAGIMSFIEDVLEQTLGARDISFLELAKKRGINFVVCVANLTRQRSEYLCVDTTPHESVVTAVRMSISLPILFAPVRHANGDLYVDGGIYETLPIGYIAEKFSHDMLRDTLAISTTRGSTDGNKNNKNNNNNNNSLNTLPEYLSALVGGLLSKVNENSRTTYLDKTGKKIRVFEIDSGPVAGVDLFCFDLENLNFNIDKERIDIAVNHGYAAMQRFLSGSMLGDEADDPVDRPGTVVGHA